MMPFRTALGAALRLWNASLAKRFASARRGVVALEFAVAGSALLILTLGVIEAGLMGWSQVVLQLTAAQTSRCAALGTSACASPTDYAVTTATSWLFANAVTSADVTIEPNVSCNGAPGHYVRVTVSSQFSGVSMLPPPLNGIYMSAHSCYYTGP